MHIFTVHTILEIEGVIRVTDDGRSSSVIYECRKSALVNVNIRSSVQQKLYFGGMPIPEVVNRLGFYQCH